MSVQELEQRALELASIGEGVSPREMVNTLKNSGSEEEVNLALRNLFDAHKIELSGSFKIVAIKTSKDVIISASMDEVVLYIGGVHGVVYLSFVESSNHAMKFSADSADSWLKSFQSMTGFKLEIAEC